MRNRKYLLPVFALIVANSLWGLSAPLIKIGLESFAVPVFIAIRFSSAAFLLLPFAMRVWRPLRRKQLLTLILAAVLDITLSVAALNVGLTKTTASNAGIIWLLMPIVLFLLSIVILKEKLQLRTLGGILVALAGSLIIIGKPWSGDAATALAGNLLVLTAVILNALAIVIIKPLTKAFHQYQITFMYYLIGVIPVLIYAGTRLSDWHLASITTRSWTALIVSIMTAVIANAVFYYALRSRTVQSTGVYQYLDPLITVIGAYVLLAERPTSVFFGGAALIALGVYIVESRVKIPVRSREGS
jgi:drug/metabolite transporter (DMT)-like permease